MLALVRRGGGRRAQCPQTVRQAGALLEVLEDIRIRLCHLLAQIIGLTASIAHRRQGSAVATTCHGPEVDEPSSPACPFRGSGRRISFGGRLARRRRSMAWRSVSAASPSTKSTAGSVEAPRPTPKR